VAHCRCRDERTRVTAWHHEGTLHRAPSTRSLSVCVGGACTPSPAGRPSYSDEKVANRDTKVWHGATENGPSTMDKSQIPRRDCRSCRYLTLCRGVLDVSIIQ
jgi:hypothetical protein